MNNDQSCIFKYFDKKAEFFSIKLKKDGYIFPIFKNNMNKFGYVFKLSLKLWYDKVKI